MIEHVDLHPADAGRAIWRTSSYSNGGGECVEVGHVTKATYTGVRDSKSKDGPVQSYAAPAWDAFLDALKIR
ncbi:DUF397 domain-containing protein [Embleya hyalina]|uniref:DUF397 domain-containing protein n=1 Tax=Embleya hyalina TaxID=516124 RepID=A0A401YIA5_9ACTN|nr:DUF397 domain-containing protein [Embleya hyalina]GCD94330.1 hypothetical protein EHYA_01990 [Embleya hyalina]